MEYSQKELEGKVNRIRTALETDLKKIQMREEYIKNEQIDQESAGGDWKAKDYENGYYLYKKRYEAMTNSTVWKVTAPLRRTFDYVHALKTGEKVRKEVREKETVKSDSRKNNKKIEIAVHLHLYYEDLMEEFFEYFTHIPEKFDLYISCREGANCEKIQQEAEKIPGVNKILIKECQNRGRDIAPFYVLFKSELQKYEYLLHVHTKKSLYTGEDQKKWRQWGLDGVLNSDASVEKSLKCLREANPRGGLVFGEMTPSLPIMALHWLRNSDKGKNLLEKMGMALDNHMLFYPVGSFFWAKRKAIQPIFDLNLSYEDFDEEKGQTDGTLAHALERVVACVVQERGYAMYIYNSEMNEMSVNKSYYPFKKYFSYNVKNISEKLIKYYDVITFDVFDTLITRICYQPEDVHRLMERTVEEKCHTIYDFSKIRKVAEEKAQEKYGDYYNIHHIYEEFSGISDLSLEKVAELKKMEIELEYDLCTPRKDVLDIFNNLIRAGKKVILITDTYFTKDIVDKMLRKCGYEGYYENWVSCERGKRKDKDTIWDDFLIQYGEKRTIHLGDDPHSDRQIIGDRKRDAILLLSSMDQFRLSRQYETFREFEHGTVEDSIILGYLINQCIYNSPFALNENGISKINNLQTLVEGVFAPLFLEFADYIQKTSRDKGKLLFLSREGYFLEKLYLSYCDSFKKNGRQHKYLLTSRRASSVPQIETYEDIKELLKSPYTGKASTLLKERFGLELREKDYFVKSLAEDMSKILITLSEYLETLLIQSMTEKNTYLGYLEQEIDKIDNLKDATLVDVGYAGSIQYYLMKMLKVRLDGCYMVTEYNIKPAIINGTFRSLYNFWSDPVFVQTTLFLEAVTAAPHGQVKYFEYNNGKYEAVMKQERKDIYEKANRCQQYILSYTEIMGKILADINPNFNKKLISKIFEEVTRTDLLSDEVKGFFSVNDEYCNDGNWVYSEELQEWKLV